MALGAVCASSGCQGGVAAEQTCQHAGGWGACLDAAVAAAFRLKGPEAARKELRMGPCTPVTATILLHDVAPQEAVTGADQPSPPLQGGHLTLVSVPLAWRLEPNRQQSNSASAPCRAGT